MISGPRLVDLITRSDSHMSCSLWDGCGNISRSIAPVSSSCGRPAGSSFERTLSPCNTNAPRGGGAGDPSGPLHGDASFSVVSGMSVPSPFSADGLPMPEVQRYQVPMLFPDTRAKICRDGRATRT